MRVFLEAIKFNHDPNSVAADALNIRKNETQLMAVPEWQRGMNVAPESSPAAYAIDETRGNILTIQAKFRCNDPSLVCFEVRALDARIRPRPTSSPSLLTFLAWLSRPVLREMTGSVLGEVEAQYVFPEEGVTDYVTFELKDTRVEEVGVGVHDILWRWQYRAGADSQWIDLAESAHRIYTVLRQPPSPWQDGKSDPSSTQLPWTEVLDYACRWAEGAHNPDDAAALVTRAVYQLGPDVVQFDTPNFANRFFTTLRQFDCTTFLRRLRGEDTVHTQVNCTDCATIVSTFANSVGCDLSQAPIKPTVDSSFNLSLHKRIGLPGRFTGSFDYHEVAWEGKCEEVSEIFDACLEVDGDDNPYTFTSLLPTNLRFGRVGERGYRFRLVRAGEESSCEPDRLLCQRRHVGYGAQFGFSEADFAWNLAGKKCGFEHWDESPTGVKLFVRNFFLAPGSLPGWELIQQQQFEDENGAQVSESFWKRTGEAADLILRIDVYEQHTLPAARRSLSELLSGFQLPGIAPADDKIFGDAAFTSPDEHVMVFAVGTLVFMLRNVGKDLAPVGEVVKFINQSLLDSQPAATNHSVNPMNRFHFESGEARVDDEVRLKEAPTDALERRRFYKFLSDKGETFLKEGSLFYRPTVQGSHVLRIYAVDAAGNALEQELPLEVLGSSDS